MPQLAEIITETLEGAVRAAEGAARRRLLSHVRALEQLAGEEPGVDELAALLEQGYWHDIAVAAEIDVTAQLTMTTVRERVVSTGGGVSFGPLQLTGTLASRFAQDTGTNLSVHIRMEVRSADDTYQRLLRGLTSAPG